MQNADLFSREKLQHDYPSENLRLETFSGSYVYSNHRFFLFEIANTLLANVDLWKKLPPHFVLNTRHIPDSIRFPVTADMTGICTNHIQSCTLREVRDFVAF